VTRLARAPRVRSDGFTLLELLVVVGIIAIIVSLVGVQLARSPGEVVRNESERLALLMQAARDEAILQGRVFAFGAARDSYRFLRLDPEGKLQVTKDDELLRPRTLPAGVSIESLQVEGAGGEVTQQRGVVLQPSGDLPGFRIQLAGAGVRWVVVGSPDGTIKVQAGL